MTENSTWEGYIYPQLELGFTICFTVFYSLLFLISNSQLWLVVYLKHKLLSTQTAYFISCSIFTGLRIILFAFFYKSNALNIEVKGILSWVFITLPVIIHYLIILMITVFYHRTYMKTKGLSYYFNRNYYFLTFVPIVLLLIITLLPIFLDTDESNIFSITSTVVTDVIFLSTIFLFVHIYRQFPKFPNATLILEAKRITKTRCIIVGTCCISISLLKFIYDIIAIVSDNKSHPVKIKLPITIRKENFVTEDNGQISFIIFGIVIFFWEVVPLIGAMIVFFVPLPKCSFTATKANSNKDIHSTMHSNSILANSNSTTKSKFIGVPKYGTINSFVNSTDTSSGPLSPVYFGSPHLFPYPIHRSDDNSFERGSTQNLVRSSNHFINKHRDFNQQPKSFNQINNKFLKPANRNIWRSSSNKCLLNSDAVPVARTNSTFLPTAAEED